MELQLTAARSPGRTVADHLRSYLAGARLRSNAVSTQAEYARVARHLMNEIGHLRPDDIDRAWLRARRDEWAVLGHRAATIRLQVLKNALEPLQSDGLISGGLFDGLQRVHRPHGSQEQNLTWTDGEVAGVINYCIEFDAIGLARAIGLGRYAGLRRGEICALQVTDRYSRPGAEGQVERRIKYRSLKGEVRADIREDPRLTDLLDNETWDYMEAVSYNKRGGPWLPRQLNQAFDRVIATLAKHDVVRPNLTLHGLRHTRGIELAYAGASDAEMMAQLAHSDEQSARVYRRQAQRAAMADRGQMLVDAMVKRQAEDARHILG